MEIEEEPNEAEPQGLPDASAGEQASQLEDIINNLDNDPQSLQDNISKYLSEARANGAEGAREALTAKYENHPDWVVPPSGPDAASTFRLDDNDHWIEIKNGIEIDHTELIKNSGDEQKLADHLSRIDLLKNSNVIAEIRTSGIDISASLIDGKKVNTVDGTVYASFTFLNSDRTISFKEFEHRPIRNEEKNIKGSSLEEDSGSDYAPDPDSLVTNNYKAQKVTSFFQSIFLKNDSESAQAAKAEESSQPKSAKESNIFGISIELSPTSEVSGQNNNLLAAKPESPLAGSKLIILKDQLPNPKVVEDSANPFLSGITAETFTAPNQDRGQEGLRSQNEQAQDVLKPGTPNNEDQENSKFDAMLKKPEAVPAHLLQDQPIGIKIEVVEAQEPVPPLIFEDQYIQFPTGALRELEQPERDLIINPAQAARQPRNPGSTLVRGNISQFPQPNFQKKEVAIGKDNSIRNIPEVTSHLVNLDIEGPRPVPAENLSVLKDFSPKSLEALKQEVAQPQKSPTGITLIKEGPLIVDLREIKFKLPEEAVIVEQAREIVNKVEFTSPSPAAAIVEHRQMPVIETAALKAAESNYGRAPIKNESLEIATIRLLDTSTLVEKPGQDKNIPAEATKAIQSRNVQNNNQRLNVPKAEASPKPEPVTLKAKPNSGIKIEIFDQAAVKTINTLNIRPQLRTHEAGKNTAKQNLITFKQPEFNAPIVKMVPRIAVKNPQPVKNLKAAPNKVAATYEFHSQRRTQEVALSPNPEKDAVYKAPRPLGETKNNARIYESGNNLVSYNPPVATYDEENWDSAITIKETELELVA